MTDDTTRNAEIARRIQKAVELEFCSALGDASALVLRLKKLPPSHPAASLLPEAESLFARLCQLQRQSGDQQTEGTA